MSIIVTKFTQITKDAGTEVEEDYPDFCVVKETFCFDPDDSTFATIGLGGGTEITFVELPAYLMVTEVRQTLTAIIGFYFGNATAGCKK